MDEIESEPAMIAEESMPKDEESSQSFSSLSLHYSSTPVEGDESTFNGGRVALSLSQASLDVESLHEEWLLSSE